MKDDEEEKEGESPEEKVNEDDDQADDNASVDEDCGRVITTKNLMRTRRQR
jgi:hypothetical protein